jgi:hypothetical protein
MGKTGSQKYNSKWEKEFFWVTADRHSIHRAYCRLCKTDMKAKLDILKDHASGKKHKMRVPHSNERAKIPFKPISVISTELKKAELKLAAMAVCHTSFNSLDHIGEIVSEEGRGSNLEKIRLHRTKARTHRS